VAERHIDMFEVELGMRFIRRPSVRRLSRLKYALVNSRAGAQCQTEIYKALKNKKSCPVYTLWMRAAYIVRLFLTEKIPFFCPETNTIYAPFTKESSSLEVKILWHELGHALLYDRNKSFNLRPAVQLMRGSEGEKEHVKDAFNEGFAWFCSDEMLHRFGHHKEMFLRQYVAADIRSIQRTYRDLIERSWELREYYMEIMDKAGSAVSGSPEEIERIWGEFKGFGRRFFRIMSEAWSIRKKLMGLRSFVGYHYVQVLTCPLKRARAKPLEMIDLLIRSIPTKFDEIFYPSLFKGEVIKVRREATCSDAPIARRPTTGIIMRNDPCPCGSGKKYKHCCGKNGKWHLK
jgi:hypothetical protein